MEAKVTRNFRIITFHKQHQYYERHTDPDPYKTKLIFLSFAHLMYTMEFENKLGFELLIKIILCLIRKKNKAKCIILKMTEAM